MLHFIDPMDKGYKNGGLTKPGADAIFGTKASPKAKTKDPTDNAVSNTRRPSLATKKQADQNATDENGTVRCSYCAAEVTNEGGFPNSKEYDHIISYFCGGRCTIDNINVSCRACNRSKSKKNLIDWQREKKEKQIKEQQRQEKKGQKSEQESRDVSPE